MFISNLNELGKPNLEEKSENENKISNLLTEVIYNFYYYLRKNSNLQKKLKICEDKLNEINNKYLDL